MELRFGLKPDTITKIRNVIDKRAGVEKIILYGSRAKGNFKPGSDIDLTLVAPNLTLSDVFKIEIEIDDLLLPYKMDISLFHHIDNEDLIDHINRVGVDFK